MRLSQAKFTSLPPSHSIPPTNAISKTLLLLLLGFFFFTLHLYIKLYKISTDSTPIGILWLRGLIKYNRFQISGNKSNETEEVKFLRSRNWLYTIFIRKTNLKLDLLSFIFFGSSEYEKMDILLEQLNFILLTKKLFKTINI